MALAIKHVHNVPLRFNYVSTPPHIIQKPRSCLPLSSVSGSETTSFGGSEVALKRSGCVARVFEVTFHCLYTRTQPYFSLVSGFVNDAPRSTVPTVS